MDSQSIVSDDDRAKPSLCLIGPNQQENLGLQYLAASAGRAGYSARLVGFTSRRDIGSVLETVRKRRPMLVGLGMSFQYSVSDYIELASALRDNGYTGHVTAGGHVATFCWRELLDECAAIDSVVLHEGEQAIVEILDRLAQGGSVDNIAGCAWRESGRATRGAVRPVLDIDSLPFPKRSETPYLVAGIPVTFMLTARGCIGECAYCCIRAFAGAADGPRFRLRSASEVGREIGELARNGVRIVFAQDDLFILTEEHRAVARIEAIRQACEQHGAGTLCWWVKGRPESLTPAVLDSAKRLGVTHVFLGIENPVAERLAYLGRTHRPEHNLRALELCREIGIHTSFNLMIFDPESPLDHVAATADFAAQHLDIPFNLCRTEIYPGTELFARLSAQQRLRGDFRSWGYHMLDMRAELAFRVLRVSLHERSFSSESLLNKLISLAFGVQAHAWLAPGQQTDALVRRVDQIGRDARQDTVDIIRRTIDFASQADINDSRLVNDFAIQQGLSASRRDLPWHQEIDRLWDLLHARGQMILQSRNVCLSP
jgi:anaerobic magnesium-protoporphyrin IX monomethyl ester cyclase